MLLFIFFEFNFYSSLLLPLVIQGLVFSVILLFRGWRENRLADKLLAILIFTLSIRVANWMLGFAGWYDSHDAYTTFMFYFPWSNNLIYGPLIWLYFRSLTNHEFKLRGKDWLHFLPFVLSIAVQLILFTSDIVVNHWISGQPLPYFYGTRGHFAEFGLGWMDTVVFIFGNLSIVGYFLYTTLQYRKYQQYINQHFSETDTISFSWFRNFLLAFLLGMAIWIVSIILKSGFNISLSYIEEWYGHFLWGIIIYYLSIGGFSTHPNLQLSLKFNPSEKKENTKLNPSINPLNPLKDKLVNHIKTQKPFLNPQLTLTELAHQLNSSPSTISKTINSCFDQNFNDFINSYRVEAVKGHLQNDQKSHLSLLGIALESGFNSKATFNRAFKKHTQQSPSEFIKTHIKEAVSN